MRSLLMVALLVALNTGACTVTREVTVPQDRVNVGVFYNELSPYGQWVDYPGYGFVWIPSVGPDFAPYASNGHWILTEYGWAWASDYSWGWAPFHYGRWDYDNFYGWFWVPDNEWGPSWVNWRRADGYYGWTPMRPGISLSVSFGGGYTVPHDRWIFVRDRDFSRDDINHYYVNRTNNITIIKNSSVINRSYTDQNRHSTYVSGPDRSDVQKVTGRTIQPVNVHDNDRPGQNLRNGQLQIYRPQVQMNDENGRRPVPSSVVNMKDVKRPSDRNTVNPIPNVNAINDKRQEGQSEQPSKVNPANEKKQEEQPEQPSKVNPTIEKKQEEQPEQPSKVNPAIEKKQEEQPEQSSKVNPANDKRQEEQPVQPSKVKPAKNNRQKVQQSRSVNPANKDQSQQPRNVNASVSKGKEQQPRAVTPLNKNRRVQPSQLKANQDEKEKRKQE